MKLCHLGWQYSLKIHRLSNQAPRFKHEKFLLSCWWSFTKKLLKSCMLLLLPLVASLWFNVSPSCWRHYTLQNQILKIWAESNLKASFLPFSFHTTRRCCARCQGREETNGPIQLWCLWTTARTSKVRKVMDLRRETPHSSQKNVALTPQLLFPANRDVYIKPNQVVMQRSTDHGSKAQFPTNQLQHNSCTNGAGDISKEVIERL